MAFWKKKSDDPWDRDPNKRRESVVYEAEPQETTPAEEELEEKPGFFADLLGGREPEENPAPVPCPYCGAEMERMYLGSGRGLVRLAKEKPGVVLGFAETVPLKDGEGFYHNWMTYWKTCRACAACRKLVVDVPEIDGAWSAEPPAETPDEAADEAYEHYLEQLKHYQ